MCYTVSPKNCAYMYIHVHSFMVKGSKVKNKVAAWCKRRPKLAKSITQWRIVRFCSSLWSRDTWCTTFKVKCQRSSLVTAWKSRLIAKLCSLFRKSGSLNVTNGDVRILIGIRKLKNSSRSRALCTQCEVRIWPKQPRTTGATSGGLEKQCIHGCHSRRFYILYLNWNTALLSG